MTDKLKGSRISRTQSLLGSFKMTDSLFVSGGVNKKIVNLQIKNIKLINKEQYKKQQKCQVCYISFTKTNRQHHCRVCANAVCSQCSPSTINKQRVCDVCAYRYSHEFSENKKEQILDQLRNIAVYFVKNKNKTEKEVKQVTEELKNCEDRYIIKQQSERKIEELSKKLRQIQRKKEDIEYQLELIKSN